MVLLLLVTPGLLRAQSAGRILEDFNKGSLSRWREKEFHGTTRYRLVPDPATGGYCLKAQCDGSASGLVLNYSYRLQDYPILSWRWKIAATLPGGDGSRRATDDYAARIYVIFPGRFFFKTRTLNYIWGNRLPRETLAPSPVTSKSMMLAVESGNRHAGEWRLERRNVLKDFRRAFGEEPPPVGAIAIMTDGDDTGGRAVAWYDDLRISSGVTASAATGE
ncbi:DUF3047 domain-containing protein [Geothermobacter hydrogeniphilus]|nr:DUF3047 domain-containing protein [Geothermobacter hydrogeniphilus]